MSEPDDFLACLRHMIDFWDRQDEDSRGKLEGLAFSVLTYIDGVANEGPGFDLVHDGQVVNESIMLHDQLFTEDRDVWGNGKPISK